MNRADVIRPEDVGEERGDGGESAAVHADHYEQAGLEVDPIAAARDAGNQEEQHDLDGKERRVGVAASQVIGTRRPEESSDQVEDAEKQYRTWLPARGVFWKRSWTMGDACARIPMPAVTLINNIAHSR